MLWLLISVQRFILTERKPHCQQLKTMSWYILRPPTPLCQLRLQSRPTTWMLPTTRPTSSCLPTSKTSMRLRPLRHRLSLIAVRTQLVIIVYVCPLPFQQLTLVARRGTHKAECTHCSRTYWGFWRQCRPSWFVYECCYWCRSVQTHCWRYGLWRNNGQG